MNARTESASASEGNFKNKARRIVKRLVVSSDSSIVLNIVKILRRSGVAVRLFQNLRSVVQRFRESERIQKINPLTETAFELDLQGVVIGKAFRQNSLNRAESRNRATRLQ